MKFETIIERDYPYHCAGRVWIIPELHLTKLPDGTVGLSLAEINRIHRAVANEVCGSAAPMTPEEFEFLASATVTPYSEVARVIGISPSTLSKWLERGGEMPRLRSTFLKRWFWFRFFGDELSDTPVVLARFRDDHDFLQFAHDEAIAKELAAEVREKVA
ncbi:MAG: hypothetical protein ABIO70_33800 [Pseudomonadota bacterium]